MPESIGGRKEASRAQRCRVNREQQKRCTAEVSLTEETRLPGRTDRISFPAGPTHSLARDAEAHVHLTRRWVSRLSFACARAQRAAQTARAESAHQPGVSWHLSSREGAAP